MVPLLPLYAAGAVLRWIGKSPRRLAWPVISVGNLSAGGTGKTPFTIALAKLLVREGFGVDVLSRGFGRSAKAVERVDPEGSAERFGDEPLLIAREAGVPVYVGARRFEAGALAEAADGEAGPSTAFGAKSAPNSAQDDHFFFSASESTVSQNESNSTQDDGIFFTTSEKAALRRVHLLDDGFQHRQLHRDVDIVLVNSEDLGDWLLQAGNMREPLSALRRATVFAAPVGDDEAVERLRRMGLEQPVWRYRRQMEIPQVEGPVAAFCGIARPEQFFAGLVKGGMTLAAKKAFRDHYRFGAEDLRELERMADRSGARALVTTEKDRVRIGDKAVHLGQVPLLTTGLRIVLEDESGVVAWLREALKARPENLSV